MIKGCPYWNDRAKLYIQTNNAIEEVLSDYHARENSVACGPTAAVNALAAMGKQLVITTPNGWAPQPEDVLLLWFHDPRNYPIMGRVRPETDPRSTLYPPHEVPQYYQEAVKKVFGVHCRFEWLHSFDKISQIVSGGTAVMVAKKKPGHYIALVAYDDSSDEIIYHDSYPPFYEDRDGFAKRIARSEWDDNIQPYSVIFS